MHTARRRTIIYCALFSLVATAGTAHAADKDKKAAAPLSSLRLRQGDEKGNDLRALKTEIFVANTEQKAIAQVHKLLKKYRGTSLEPDLQLRLAELYMRRAKTDRFMVIQRKSESMVELAPKMILSAEPRRHVKSAIAIYDRIEKRWPHYERMDEVYFNNAFANQQISHPDRAEVLFNKLIRNYAESPLIPDAHLAVGEMAFGRQQFEKALKHFQAIKKYPDSMVYPYGLYKSAWTYYNLRDAGSGLKELEAVVKYGRFVKEQGIDSRLDLRKEALNDMALFYEDVMPAKTAFRYFEKQAGELDVSPVILKLSYLYKRHSRHKDNRILLGEFIKRRPYSAHVPSAYVEFMEASEKLKMHSEVIALLHKMSDLCQADGRWAKEQNPNFKEDRESPLLTWSESSNENLTPAQICDRAFRKTAMAYADKWLKTWNRDHKQTEYADNAEQAFEIYLKQDPKTEESAKARFVYAELLFKRNKFREASENYAVAASITSSATMGHDASYFALISLEKAVKDKWSDKDEKTFVGLSDIYLKKYPKGKFVLDVQFKLAFISYEKGRYDVAAPLFKKLGHDYAKTSRGLKAQDLYLDILNIKKDYATLREYSKQLLKGTKNRERVAKLTKLYEQSYFLLVQNLEEKKDYKQAIAEYEAFSRDNPRSGLAKEANWNAMQLKFKAGDLFGGAESAAKFATTYKDDKKALDALMKAAQTYESIGQLDRAAAVLVKLAHMDTANKNRWNALAADFYLLSDNVKAAQPLYEKLTQEGDKATVTRSLEKLENIALARNDVAQHEAVLKRMAKSGNPALSTRSDLYFVQKLYQQKRYSDAFSGAMKILSQSGATAETKANARLLQARVLAKEFREQSLKSRLERINMVLELKTEKLGKAQVAYQSAARYGDPKVAVIANSELADLYLDYSNGIKQMPVPQGVPENEVAAFRGEMMKLAIPMEEKGIETKNIAFNQAKALGIGDDLVTGLKRELEELNHQSQGKELVSLEAPAAIVPKLGGA